MPALLTPVVATSAAPRRWWGALPRPAASGPACVLGLLLLCGVLFFYGLNLGELWGTESLRAVVAAEMLRSGDWIVPRLHGEPLLTKPPGMYLAIVLCSLPVGGVTEWTARLPSALAATATVFLVYWYFGRQLGRFGGFVAALMLPLAPLWLEKASAGDIDMLQVFWTTAAILFLLRALEEEQASREAGEQASRGAANVSRNASKSSVLQFPCSPALLFSLLCVAGGFLTKWTTPAFFYAAAVPLLWSRGQLRLLLGKQHLAAAGLAVGICAAWLAAVVAQVGWPAFAGTLEQEALQRLVPNYEGRPYPWHQTLLHPVKVLAMGLPFSILALWTLHPSFYRLWDKRGQRLLVALHCWTWPNLLLWSLPTEHKARFSFPLLPGMSGLAAMVMLAWMTGKLPWRGPVWVRARSVSEDRYSLTNAVGGHSALGPKSLLIGILAFWIVLKIGYAHGLINERNQERSARAAGDLLAQLVPADQMLYLLDIKDDGILFYFGRPALKLHAPAQLPDVPGPLYCLLTGKAPQDWRSGKNVEVVQEIPKTQGALIYLVRVTAP